LEDDPLKSLAAGVTEGALDWTEQKVKDLVKRFKDRKLAFIKNSDNIERVKEERKSSEFLILRQFVPKGTKYSIQIQMGLTLRRIADDQHRAMELRNIIKRTFGNSGLHVAEVTQIGLTNQLLTRLVELYPKPEEVTDKLHYFLDHIEDLAIFVKNDSVASAIASLIPTRIDSYTIHLMILCGSGFATNVVLDVLKQIEAHPRKYIIEMLREGPQIAAFIFTPELKARISHWSDSLDFAEDSDKT
jgi:hypothetical protein